MDVGIVEGLVVVLPMWALSAAVLYWIIRLGVRHGTLDAYRIDRIDQRFAKMHADAARRAEGGADPE